MPYPPREPRRPRRANTGDRCDDSLAVANAHEQGSGLVGGVVGPVDRPGAGPALDTRPGEITFMARHAAPSPRFRAYHSLGDAAAGQTLAAGVNPGDVITDVQVILIFWGTEWTQPTPPLDSADVIAAVNSVCDGAYVRGLQEYGMRSATHSQTVFVPGGSLVNFQDAAVQGVVTGLLNAGSVPLPNSGNHFDYLYCVVLPSTATYGPGGVNGYHSTYAWTNPATGAVLRPRYAMLLNDGTLDFVSTVFSHELAEAVTDPDGGGIQIAPGSPTNWNEISDVCRSVAYVNGVAVQSFWSQAHQACVVPYYWGQGPIQEAPAGVALEVVAIRRGYSTAIKKYYIAELRTRDASGNVYELTRDQVASAISAAANTFYVSGSGGARIPLEVRTDGEHPYVATRADGDPANNLLSLPAF